MERPLWRWKKEVSRDIYLLSPTKRDESVSMPIIEFKTTTKSIDFSGVDTLLFTSKQGVKVANQISKEWQKYPSIVIGDATQRELLKSGGKILYTSKKFYGKDLVQEIKKRFFNKKILYLRPEIISFDIASNLSNIKEAIIYKTSCKKYNLDKRPSKSAIIIFTSPSTIKCFLENFSWDSSYIAVVIGESTQKALPKYIKNYYISDKPMIEECIKKALEIE